MRERVQRGGRANDELRKGHRALVNLVSGRAATSDVAGLLATLVRTGDRYSMNSFDVYGFPAASAWLVDSDKGDLEAVPALDARRGAVQMKERISIKGEALQRKRRSRRPSLFDVEKSRSILVQGCDPISETCHRGVVRIDRQGV